MLRAEELNVFYGGIHAIRDMSFHVPEGQIVTLIGSNGAGKSTTLKALSGIVRPKSGAIHFENNDITSVQSEKIVGRGLIHVPEGRRIFTELNVEENLLMGAFLRTDKNNVKEDLRVMYKQFPRLKERAKQMGGTLSGGEQQMLAIARGLMSRPKLIMLDEPSMGLAPIIIEEIFESIVSLNKDTGLTVLLVEQNANIALEIADYGYVLESGKILFSGKGFDLLSDDRVRKAYLGEE